MLRISYINNILFKNYMIRESFIFLPKITQNKEKAIWTHGVSSWDDFLKEKKIGCISDKMKPHYDQLITNAKDKLYSENHEFFSNSLPSGEHWRLYNFFKEDACFLDIETTGYHGDITVLGLYDGVETKTFVKGETLFKEQIEKELNKYKMFITFNGASFDLPVIKKQFGLNFNQLHVDLRFVSKKIGLSGGLKKIEQDIGIKRADEVVGVTGEDAVLLWRDYRRTGDKKYLDLLVKYNEEDIINLKQLANYTIPRLWAETKKL